MTEINLSFIFNAYAVDVKKISLSFTFFLFFFVVSIHSQSLSFLFRFIFLSSLYPFVQKNCLIETNDSITYFVLFLVNSWRKVCKRACEIFHSSFKMFRFLFPISLSPLSSFSFKQEPSIYFINYV